MTTNLRVHDFDVEVVRSSARRSTASLRHDASGRFVLAVPVSAGEKWIREFIAGKRTWMQKMRQQAEALSAERVLAPGSTAYTRFYTLRFALDENLSYPKYRVVRDLKARASTFYLAAEFFAPEKSAGIYEHLEKYLLSHLAKFGAAYLIERAQSLGARFKINPKEIFVRAQKSRLGYCTYDDRIMLNARLLFMPDALIDYVICHELAHTKHKNHSKHFWAYLEKLYPGAKSADKRLRDRSLFSMRISQ